MARIDVIMPQMGESIAEGTLSRWLKKVGDEVKRDEPIFEISTDKVDAEIPSPSAGILLEILVTEGTTVPINTVVARIGEAGTQPVARDALKRTSSLSVFQPERCRSTSPSTACMSASRSARPTPGGVAVTMISQVVPIARPDSRSGPPPGAQPARIAAIGRSSPAARRRQPRGGRAMRRPPTKTPHGGGVCAELAERVGFEPTYAFWT